MTIEIRMEQFSLRWNSYQASVAKTFASLRNESAYCDVTLVSDDEQMISAHKVVLSSSSEFFKNILDKIKSNPNPLIFLSGVEAKNLNLILDYVQGEVKVDHLNLDNFLKVAQKLKIDGITGGVKYEEEETFDSDVKVEETDCFETIIEEDVNEPTRKERKVESQTSEEKIISGRLSKYMERMRKVYEGREAVTALLEQCGDGWRCRECGKIARTKGNLELHAEGHIHWLSFDCNKCDRQFRSRTNLSYHKKQTHKKLYY